MVSPEPLPATIGRYSVVRLIGRGAMGRVLLAHDPVLERDVALKHLRNDLSITPEQREALLRRMRQEARASARVSHPNIIALHDMGEDPELGLFLVFEYVDGPTLKERLTRGPLGPLAAARLAREVGDALSTAHKGGVVHRDIKPENIILAKTGAKVADFGIARLPNSTLTRDGGLLGTPAYSAPESISSEIFSSRSDQFALAATLYEAISGRRAFPGDDAVAVASRIATEEPPKIAEVCCVDPQVDRILARGLAKNPKSRFDDCTDFGSTLAEALEQSSRANMPTVPDGFHKNIETQDVPQRRLPIIIGAALAGGLISVMLLQIAGVLGSSTTSQAATVRTEGVAAALKEQPVAWLRERPEDGNPSGASNASVQKEQIAPASSVPKPAHRGVDAGTMGKATHETQRTATQTRLRVDAGAH